MERRIPLKTAIFLVLIFLSLLPLTAQNLSQNNRIQFILWAEREVYPGVEWNSKVVEAESVGEDDYTIPVNRLKQTAPFFVGGLLYGWNFEYTPSDKARKVDEYMDFSPVRELLPSELNSIRYKNTALKDDRLYCRVEYDRTEEQKNLYRSWQSITNPKIRGTGYAPLSKGFDGIRLACQDAIKMAVRDYWRTKIKNKPREISGRIMLSAPPVVAVDSGRYKVTLDFFMETDRILEYEKF
jgi:hypothetical protein